VHYFLSGAVRLAFIDEGVGPPVLLIHGFASRVPTNWIEPGWVSLLTASGFRVVAFDNRGHGESDKLYDPAQYTARIMAADARALLDHLGIARADVMGYSMGARITANLAVAHPDRLRSAILGGVGKRLIAGGGLQENVVEALEARSIDEVTDPQGYVFRRFAEQTKSDLRALAACVKGGGPPLPRAEVAALKMPLLIAVGTKDTIAGSPHELAALIPQARVLAIPDRDHMLAVGDRVYKNGVLAFLRDRP